MTGLLDSGRLLSHQVLPLGARRASRSRARSRSPARRPAPHARHGVSLLFLSRCTGPQTMFGLLNKVRPILPGHNNGSVASALARWGVAFGLIGFFMVREELPDPFAKTEKPTE